MSSVFGRLRGIFGVAPNLDLLAKEKDLKKVVENFKQFSAISDFRRVLRTYEKTVERLVYHKQYTLIEDLLEDQKKYVPSSSEKFAVRLISLYGKAGMFEHAQKLFDELPELRRRKRTVISLNGLLSACVHSKRLDKVDEIFRKLPSELSLEVDRWTYNIAVRGYCLMGSLDPVLSLFEEMEKKGIWPDTVTFGTSLDAFYKNGKFSEGERLWELMLSKKISPTLWCYNLRMCGMVSEGRVSDAVKLFDEMRDKGVAADKSSYNTIITAYCRNGDLEEAKRWYQRLVESKCKVNHPTVATLALFLCEKGDYEMAHQLCIESMDRKSFPDTNWQQSVVDFLVRESKIELAKEIVQKGSMCKPPYKIHLPQAA